MRTASTTYIAPVTCDPEGRLQRLPREEIQFFQGDLKSLHEDQYAQLKGSIERHGFFAPVFLWEGRVLDGHQRLHVLDREGWEVEGGIPVVSIVAADEHDAAEKLLLLSSTYGKIDSQGLHEFTEAHEIRMDDFDLADLPGLDLDAFKAEFYETEENQEEVEAQEPPEDPVSRLGDLWVMGEHRLLCGDSTDEDDVSRVMAGKKADAVLTDPPYGQAQPGVDGDDPEEHAALMRDSVPRLPVKNAVIVAFQSPRTFPEWLDAIRETGFKFERMLTLYKEAQCTYPWRGWILISESILVASVGKPLWQDVHPYQHDAYTVNEVSGEIPDGLGWHGSVKPIAVVGDILCRICPVGSLVFDGFMGSGTTLVACEKFGRVSAGLELTPLNVDVSVLRWQEYTGKEATLDGTGQTFAELAAERSEASVAA